MERIVVIIFFLLLIPYLGIPNSVDIWVISFLLLWLAYSLYVIGGDSRRKSKEEYQVDRKFEESSTHSDFEEADKSMDHEN